MENETKRTPVVQKQEELNPAQADLFDFFKGITELILPSTVNDKSIEELKQSKQAVICILMEGKCVFGMPLGVYTESDTKTLLSLIEKYKETNLEYKRTSDKQATQRYINKESGEMFDAAKEIINQFYAGEDFSVIYRELERFSTILEFINEQKKYGISIETAIGIIGYASVYAAHIK